MIYKAKRHTPAILGIAFGIFLLSSGLGHADDGDYMRGKSKKEWEAQKSKMFEQLGLSEEQKKALKLHKDAHRNDMKALREQIKEKRSAFREALQNPDSDEAAIKSANGEIRALKNELNDKRLSGILEVRKILTPEQFEKFNKLKNERRSKRPGDKKGSQMH